MTILLQFNTYLLQVEGDTIAQYGEAEFVFVRSYLVSDDSC